MIELKNVKKIFDYILFSNVNMIFKENNIYLIKGKSGSGKSSLLNIIAGLDNEYEGNILFKGYDWKKVNSKEYEFLRKSISYTYQQSLLVSHLTVLENLLFFANDNINIDYYLKEFNLYKIKNKLPSQISGGERQRVALVRSLMSDSKLILLDEPTSNLDKNNSLKFAALLNKIDKKDKIIIIVTHKNIFDNIADEIINISEISNTKCDYLNEKKEKIVLKKKNYIKIDILYCLKKYLNNFKIFKTITNALFILIILIILSLNSNFITNIETCLKSIIPYDSYEINNEVLNIFNGYDYNLYYDYSCVENDFIVRPLLYKEDSSLAKSDLLAGDFPSNKEVLISKNYYNMKYNNKLYNDVLNEQIIINNETYKISGIVNIDTNDIMSTVFYNDISEAMVLMNYNEIKDKCLINQEKMEIVLLNADNNLRNKLMNENYNSLYSNEIDTKIEIISSVYEMLKIVIRSILILLFIFLFATNYLEMYYSRKKIGYLKIFNISNNRIKFLYIIQSIIFFTVSLIISIFIYKIVQYYIYSQFCLRITLSSNLYLNIILLYVYNSLVVLLPLNLYLKKPMNSLFK